MHCIHESVYVQPAAFAAALCRKIVFCQCCSTRPGAAGTNRCTFYINLLLLKANKAEGEKKINVIQLKMWLLLWGNCMMKSSINPGVCAATHPLYEYLFPSRSWTLHRNWLSLDAARRWFLSARHSGDARYRNLSGMHDSEGQQAKQNCLF